MLRPPANDRQPLARLHEGQAVVTGDNDGLLALGAAVERGHGVARVCPEEHAAHRAVEGRRLTHRHLPYSLHGEPGQRAARVAQHEGARTGGSEHGDHHAVRVTHVVARAPVSCPLFSPDHPGARDALAHSSPSDVSRIDAEQCGLRTTTSTAPRLRTTPSTGSVLSSTIHFEATALDELFFVHPELPRLNCSLGAFGHSVTCYASTNGAASHTPHP